MSRIRVSRGVGDLLRQTLRLHALQIAAGGGHSLATLQQGIQFRSKAWGDNQFGQYGNGSTASGLLPVPGGVPTVTALAAGQDHCMALGSTAPGEISAWGRNQSGQLGIAAAANPQRPSPVMLTARRRIQGITAIAGGGEHSLALGPGGTVLAWGSNSSGQLGDGLMASRNVPATVKRLDEQRRRIDLLRIVFISAGTSHSLAVEQGGTVVAWGDNTFGQLGDGTANNRRTAVSVPGFSQVVAVAAGRQHSLALDASGGVWAWGDNHLGQLGDGNGGWTGGRAHIQLSPISIALPALQPRPRVTAIAAGSAHSLALLQDGRVLAWGDNSVSQLGYGMTTGFYDTPWPVSNFGGVFTIAPEQDRVIAIAAGESHSLVLLRNGQVWAWGANQSGQLGDGTSLNRNVPVFTRLS